MFKRSKHSFLDFMLVDDIEFEGVFDLASVPVDLVMRCELCRDNNFLGHPHFLLACEWVVVVLGRQHKLQFFTEFILRLNQFIFEFNIIFRRLAKEFMLLLVSELVHVSVDDVG